MPSVGLARQVQQSFAGGMWRSGSPELIPPDGAYDLSNCLLDLLGGVYRRGGTAYRSTASFGSVGLRWIWDGWLANGQTTLIASTTAFGRVSNVGVVTNLGEGGLASAVRPAVFNGKLYFPGGKTYDGTTWATSPKVAAFYAVVANRVLAAEGNKVYFSLIGEAKWEATDFHQLPAGVQILGIEGSRESAVVFTTGGIFVISGMASNLTDAVGNVQQRIDHYSGDLILWGDAGVASWEGSLIVPGTDAVWLVRRGVTSEVVQSFERISDPIRDLYQQYVRLGYQPGRAAVFANHYVLPIIGAGRVVDVLVCRLDMPAARGHPAGSWTRLAGYGAAGAYASRVSPSASREPELMGATYGADARVLSCAYFNPSQSSHRDADGSVPVWTLETRAFPTGNLVPNLVSRLRVRYQLEDDTGSPTLTAAVASDAPATGASIWGQFVWGVGKWASPGTGAFLALPGQAPEDLEGSKPFVWNVRKKRRAVRFRLTCNEPSAQLSLKALELFVRPQGRI